MSLTNSNFQSVLSIPLGPLHDLRLKIPRHRRENPLRRPNHNNRRLHPASDPPSRPLRIHGVLHISPSAQSHRPLLHCHQSSPTSRLWNMRIPFNQRHVARHLLAQTLQLDNQRQTQQFRELARHQRRKKYIYFSKFFVKPWGNI